MARLFNGSNQYLTGTGGIIAGSNGPFTIMLWFKPADLTQIEKYLLFNGRAGANNQWALLWEYAANQVEFFSTVAGNDPRAGSGITLSDTNWHHIAYRKAAAGASEWAKFLDGAKTVINASLDFTLTSAGDVFRVASADPVGGHPSCTVAEIVCTGRALSDGEILAAARGAFRTAPGDDYWPLYGAALPEPHLGQSVVLNSTYNLSGVNAPSIADHAPVGPPFPGFTASRLVAGAPPLESVFPRGRVGWPRFVRG